MELDAAELLRRVADRIPSALRPHVVVIGSIASAWAFRDVSGTHTVATKDIDLLLRPAVDAIATAEWLGQSLLETGWLPQFPNGIAPGRPDTPDDELPALRLRPPDGGSWFIELLAEPSLGQASRKHWRRFSTTAGDFGLPSFRFMPTAVHGAEPTEFGLRVARPARMALAHLLEHAEPDRTPIAGMPGQPPRFAKDVGRAVALWWLAREQSGRAGEQWLSEWRETLGALHAQDAGQRKNEARAGLLALGNYLREAHAIARASVLAPHGTSPSAWQRAYARLLELVDEL
jgi:hypothetical protein